MPALLLDFLYLILAFFYLPNFLFRGKHRFGFKERLGIYDAKTKESISKSDSIIWLHAVSVGEVKAAAVLMEKLRLEFTGHKLVVSTVTSTGNAVAKKMCAPEDIVIYLPFDLSFIVKKVFALIKPKLLLITETEIWPNLIMQAGKDNVPVAVINGRISQKAFPRYRVLTGLFGPVLEKVDLFCMQTEKDVEKIIMLGAKKDRVHNTGNLKFDQIKCPQVVANFKLDIKSDELLIVAGSTHDKEESIIAHIFMRLQKEHSNLRLLIAPRHAYRAQKIGRMLSGYGLNYVFTSKMCFEENKANGKPVFLLDEIGVLNQFYAQADIVFVGGSLIAHGGQNPLEAAACSKPIVFGKYMFNFEEICNILLKNQAAVSVDNEENLYEALNRLIKSGDLRKRLGKAAKITAENNRGCAQRILNLLQKVNRFS
ncbi:MAG: 3-deoxy-D-manno-octulosonic acid transferase [Candidatus Omnitrophica bacterium]|nr:3-deoxy-D-manno-octulosonic acid transferase [Candidatus Omnitrophota bacterium]